MFAQAEPVEGETFERAYAELQQVIDQLEHGGLGLEEAVVLFERGSALAQTCQRIVDAAQLRVTRLAAESAAPSLDAPAQ